MREEEFSSPLIYFDAVFVLRRILAVHKF